jgi:hypothetical protein
MINQRKPSDEDWEKRINIFYRKENILVPITLKGRVPNGKSQSVLYGNGRRCSNHERNEFIKKYGEQYHYVWRNEQVWIESNKKKGIEQDRNPEDFHEMWENGG